MIHGITMYFITGNMVNLLLFLKKARVRGTLYCKLELDGTLRKIGFLCCTLSGRLRKILKSIHVLSYAKKKNFRHCKISNVIFSGNIENLMSFLWHIDHTGDSARQK